MKEVSIRKFASDIHFKRIDPHNLNGGGSFTLVDDGKFVGVFVVPASAEKKYQIEAICSQMNAALGIQ